MRQLERIVLLAALAVAGVALYLALDARDTATKQRDQADQLRAQVTEQRGRLANFHPTLVVQQRVEDPFTAPRVKAGTGLQNVRLACDDGAVVVGGGFNGFDGATIVGSLPQGGGGGSRASGDGWLVNAVNENGGRGRVAPSALCARGEGGLRVRSTGTSARAKIGP